MSAVAPLRTVALIARREFLARVRGRAFLVSTVVILVVIVGYALFVGSLGAASDPGTSTIAVSPETEAITPALRTAADDQGRIVTVVPVPDAAAGRALVASGGADAALSGTPTRPRVDVESSLSGGTGSIVSVATSLTAQAQLAATRGVDPAALDAAIAAAEPVVVAARPEDPAEGLRIGLGAVGAFLLYFSIQTYGAFVAQGVVEEKASRVVELVLATVRPWQLLLGKVLGLGAVGLVQLVVLGAAGLGVAGSAGLLVSGRGARGDARVGRRLVPARVRDVRDDLRRARLAGLPPGGHPERADPGVDRVAHRLGRRVQPAPVLAALPRARGALADPAVDAADHARPDRAGRGAGLAGRARVRADSRPSPRACSCSAAGSTRGRCCGPGRGCRCGRPSAGERTWSP